jgi:hypothetical protein
MSIQEAIRATVALHGKRWIESIILRLKSSGHFGGGRIAASLRSTVEDGGDKLSLQIFGDESLSTIMKGRKPGKQPPLEVIKDWISVRGLPIPENEAFGIARHIGRFGIKPLDLLADKTLLLHNLTTDVEKSIVKAAKEMIKAQVPKAK